ncbi:hypothetical protein C8R47DRAFT_1220523 [Mycena vitilis]|nr:hypothetical protein C8R47DRAFT_1220523 [Mycena vitilis]
MEHTTGASPKTCNFYLKPQGPALVQCGIEQYRESPNHLPLRSCAPATTPAPPLPPRIAALTWVALRTLTSSRCSFRQRVLLRRDDDPYWTLCFVFDRACASVKASATILDLRPRDASGKVAQLPPRPLPRRRHSSATGEVDAPATPPRPALTAHNASAGLLLGDPSPRTHPLFAGSAPLTRLDLSRIPPIILRIPARPAIAPKPPAFRTLQNINDEDMATLSFFTGDRNTDAIDAVDFIKEAEIYFRRTKVTDEAIMLKEAGDHFRNRSNTDRWFTTTEVQADINGSWAKFVTVFKERFEGIYPKEKPAVQLIAELSGMRISLGDLARDHVMVGGEKYAPMEEFLGRLKDAVSAASALKARDGVFQFHADLPAQLRSAVGDAPADWGAMITALQDIPLTTIKTAVEEYKSRTAMERNIAEIQRRLASTQLGAHVAPVVVAPRVQAVATHVAPVVAPVVVPQAPGGPAVQEAARGPRRGAGREGTDAEKAALRAVLAECVRQRAPNTPEGMVRYQAQLAAWRTRNPGEERLIAIETSGYPLQPGTADPCSAECWRCGFVVRPVHGQACPGPFVPDLERRFRMVCGQWLGRTQPAAAAHYVEEIVAGVPWYEAAGAGGEDFVAGAH